MQTRCATGRFTLWIQRNENIRYGIRGECTANLPGRNRVGTLSISVRTSTYIHTHAYTDIGKQSVTWIYLHTHAYSRPTLTGLYSRTDQCMWDVGPLYSLRQLFSQCARLILVFCLFVLAKQARLLYNVIYTEPMETDLDEETASITASVHREILQSITTHLRSLTYSQSSSQFTHALIRLSTHLLSLRPVIVTPLHCRHIQHTYRPPTPLHIHLDIVLTQVLIARTWNWYVNWKLSAKILFSKLILAKRRRTERYIRFL